MLEQLLPVRQQESKRFIQRLLQKGVAGEAVDFGGELMTLSNNTVSIMTVGHTSTENEKDGEEMRKLVADSAELVGSSTYRTSFGS